MDLVFSTDQIEPAKRYASWRDAICDVYVHVDVNATDPDNYKGFIRETRFGDISLTDILLSEQRINRGPHHISQLDKDCYYLQLLHYGRVNVLQRGDTRASNVARGALFSASEQYELQCIGEVRALYVEMPRDRLAQRFAQDRVPVTATVNCTQGLGRIATELCAALATEGARLAEPVRAELGSQLMDILALTLSSPEGGMSMEGSVRQARLRSVQQWIEEHLGHPDLSLDRIAHANGISLRYLHLLFRGCEMSAAEWLWHRRLQRAYDLIAKGDGRSITSIAFAHGFNSSAHFSTMFRRKYGVSPRNVGRSRQ
jgi:AraC-like DNA-binding protein